jgi:MerR family redox-sensitive transcriptional activator SoxR
MVPRGAQNAVYLILMALLLISDVARQMGLRPSAIRYYEEIGILPSPRRTSGQRRYDTTVLHRLAIVQRARQIGFTLEEIRALFFGFSSRIPASARWRQLSQRKLGQLETQMNEIKAMRRVLTKMMQGCSCNTLDQCGKGIYSSACSGSQKCAPRKQLPRRKRA